ncbi:MAG: hypothetical protein AB1650_01485 [Candidatus Omnitrophota bacterium]
MKVQRKQGQGTLEFVVLITMIVGILLIFLNPQTGVFTRSLFSTVDMTANGMSDMSSRLSHVQTVGPGDIVLFDSDGWDLSDFRLGEVGTASTILYEGEEVFLADGKVNFFTKDSVLVDTDKSYLLSGEFMSTGDAPGTLYFGLIPYDENGDRIYTYETHRVGNAGTVLSINDMTITTSETLDGWNQETEYAGWRMLGVYLDGDTTHLPDYVVRNYTDYYSTDPTDGTYQSATGNTITLNDPLPKDVVDAINANLGTAIVMDHRSAAAYIYAATTGNEKPPLDTWTTYSAVITGEDFNTNTEFWPETASVGIVLLANYYPATVDPPDLDQSLIFQNITFTELAE